MEGREQASGSSIPQEEDPVDSLTRAARLRVGLVMNGKWRLDELIGVGGMAAVYAATHRNGNRVAVKVLHPHFVANDSIRSRFQREGYVANKIEHPGAVRVLDDDATADGAVFLVMELLEGETLENRLRRRGWLPADEALSIVYHLLDVLAAAHDRGIIHRDIKPDNVFITRTGLLKVLDFGIARLAESSAEQKVARTNTNATLGTPAYMAPEQALARSSEVDARTDVWAVGATLFKLLTGRTVHEGLTSNEQLVHAATRPAPLLVTMVGDVPGQLAMVVDRALAFDKLDRWPDARAMQEAMRPLLGWPTAGEMPPVRPTSLLRSDEALDGRTRTRPVLRPGSGTPTSQAPGPSGAPTAVGARAQQGRGTAMRLVLIVCLLAGAGVGGWLALGRQRSAPITVDRAADTPEVTGPGGRTTSVPMAPPAVGGSPGSPAGAPGGGAPTLVDPATNRVRPDRRKPPVEKRRARSPGGERRDDKVDDDLWDRRH